MTAAPIWSPLGPKQQAYVDALPRVTEVEVEPYYQKRNARAHAFLVSRGKLHFQYDRDYSGYIVRGGK